MEELSWRTTRFWWGGAERRRGEKIRLGWGGGERRRWRSRVGGAGDEFRRGRRRLGGKWERADGGGVDAVWRPCLRRPYWRRSQVAPPLPPSEARREPRNSRAQQAMVLPPSLSHPLTLTIALSDTLTLTSHNHLSLTLTPTFPHSLTLTPPTPHSLTLIPPAPHSLNSHTTHHSRSSTLIGAGVDVTSALPHTPSLPLSLSRSAHSSASPSSLARLDTSDPPPLLSVAAAGGEGGGGNKAERTRSTAKESTRPRGSQAVAGVWALAQVRWNTKHSPPTSETQLHKTLCPSTQPLLPQIEE